MQQAEEKEEENPIRMTNNWPTRSGWPQVIRQWGGGACAFSSESGMNLWSDIQSLEAGQRRRAQLAARESKRGLVHQASL